MPWNHIPGGAVANGEESTPSWKSQFLLHSLCSFGRAVLAMLLDRFVWATEWSVELESRPSLPVRIELPWHNTSSWLAPLAKLPRRQNAFDATVHRKWCGFLPTAIVLQPRPSSNLHLRDFFPAAMHIRDIRFRKPSSERRLLPVLDTFQTQIHVFSFELACEILLPTLWLGNIVK